MATTTATPITSTTATAAAAATAVQSKIMATTSIPWMLSIAQQGNDSVGRQLARTTLQILWQQYLAKQQLFSTLLTSPTLAILASFFNA
jgi:hypothetical protein